MNVRIAAVLVLASAAACSKSDDQRAGDGRDASGRRSVQSVCPSPDSVRGPRLAGVLPNDSADRKAEPMPPAPLFRYPDELAQQRIGGRAIADFVVDTNGTVDLLSVAVRESSDPRITEGVCLYLAASRFNPATENGRAVRVRRELPFNFQFGPAR